MRLTVQVRPHDLTARALGRGFTLIELLTAISIMSILMMLSVPMYRTFIVNSQIRTAAESIVEGMRIAQVEAVKRNTSTEFVLDANGWSVNDLSDTNAVAQITHVDFATNGAKDAQVAGGGRVSFNGLGRILATNVIGGTQPIQRVDVTIGSGNRNLRVLVGGAGASYGIRLCDPAAPVTDLAACPDNGN